MRVWGEDISLMKGIWPKSRLRRAFSGSSVFGGRSAWQLSVGRWHRENRHGAVPRAGAWEPGTRPRSVAPGGSKHDTDDPGVCASGGDVPVRAAAGASRGRGVPALWRWRGQGQEPPIPGQDSGTCLARRP